MTQLILIKNKYNFFLILNNIRSLQIWLYLRILPLKGPQRIPFFRILRTCINPPEVFIVGFSSDDNTYASTILLPYGEDNLLHDHRKEKRLLTKKDSKKLHIIKGPWTY